MSSLTVPASTLVILWAAAGYGRFEAFLTIIYVSIFHSPIYNQKKKVLLAMISLIP